MSAFTFLLACQKAPVARAQLVLLVGCASPPSPGALPAAPTAVPAPTASAPPVPVRTTEADVEQFEREKRRALEAMDAEHGTGGTIDASVDLWRRKLTAAGAPERVCTVDADCAVLWPGCCGAPLPVNASTYGAAVTAMDDPRCHAVKCQAPARRHARCVSGTCELHPSG